MRDPEFEFGTCVLSALHGENARAMMSKASAADVKQIPRKCFENDYLKPHAALKHTGFFQRSVILCTQTSLNPDLLPFVMTTKTKQENQAMEQKKNHWLW